MAYLVRQGNTNLSEKTGVHGELPFDCANHCCLSPRIGLPEALSDHGD